MEEQTGSFPLTVNCSPVLDALEIKQMKGGILFSKVTFLAFQL